MNFLFIVLFLMAGSTAVKFDQESELICYQQEKLFELIKLKQD